MSDPTRNHPDKIASNNKVIVLKMPSFKFDPSKNFLTSSTTISPTTDSAPPLISFKPQQFATVQPQIHSKVQFTQQVVSPGGQKIAPLPGTYLIKTQSSSGKQQITAVSQVSKIPEVPPQQFTTFRSKPSPDQHIIKSGTLLLQPKPVISTQVPVPCNMKAFTITTKIPQTSQKVTITPSKPVPKLHVPTAKPIPIRPRTEIPQTQPTISNFARFNAATQKWSVPSAPVPALTLIQPRIVKVDETKIEKTPENDNIQQEKMLKISEKIVVEKIIEKIPEKVVEIQQETPQVDESIDDDEEEPFTVLKTPEKPKSAEERRLEVMRIIEGDENEIAQQIAIITQSKHESDVEESSQQDSSSSMLLCDEKIESISPDGDNNNKESVTTPEKVESPVDVVKKKLDLEENDKENVEMEVDSEVESRQDVEETIVKAEIEKTKPKRSRKPKNPTIIATLGLPYKPAGGAQRKTKVEKKLEFELDFHDPVNKIQWDDGIGGLNNCNRLFGFDEFGLVEVLSKKDAMAKLKDKGDHDCNFNFRKISDPCDQFVCSVCSKLGTIRDFYSPECCSESCLAITKRKSTPEVRDESSESGITTPVDERKLMFGGEMIPLQQLQQQLLEQHLPPSKRQRSKKRIVSSLPETKFQWDTYLSARSIPAPLSLFKSPYPRAPNPFKVGMKLEAIDPLNPKLFCVCTVEEKLGYRIKLHFDGYPTVYDFWVNADSQSIFPAGFCHSTNRQLQTPPKWSTKKFDWSEYLDYTNSIGAQRAMFPRLSKEVEGNPFQVGMRLEVMSKDHLYVGNVADVLESRLLVEFNDKFEWFDIHSPFLHPCNYHKTLTDPSIFQSPFQPFDWKEYLKETGAKEAPAEFLFFRTRSPYDFESAMKIEVVDPVNRQLIRPATVLSREDYKINVLFDGFDIFFGFWLDDDSENIHPINWCEKTGHPIEHPAGFNKSCDNGLCPSSGCRGIGNGKHLDRYFHDNDAECPYNKKNWDKLMTDPLPPRTDVKPIGKRSNKQSEISACAHKDASQLKEEVPENDDTNEDLESPSELKVSKQRGRKRKTAPEVPEDGSKRMKVTKAFIEDYGPQINYSYNLWKRNSRVLDRARIDDAITENPQKWSVENVRDYVYSITDDDEVAEKFIDQEIDGDAFISMCQDDIQQLMNVKMGHAIKIYNRILHLREEVHQKFMKL